jgi:cell division inhibitor SepF
MAGAMRKVGEYLGLVEQADFDDDFDDEPSMPVPVKRERDPERRPAVVRPTTVSNLEEHRRPRSTSSEPSSDLYRIETVTPRTYNDARTVGEHYRSGVPVIMNLSEIDDDDAKRLVDFAAGLVFAVHGSINRVTAKVFLLSPANVEVTDEDRQRIAAGGFYNQS